MKLVEHIPLMRGAKSSDSETMWGNRPVRRHLASDLLRRVPGTNEIRAFNSRKILGHRFFDVGSTWRG